MRDLFEIAGGSVAGNEHVRAGKNNQDAFYWMISKDAIAAIVTDGCSSAPYSEVGAHIGARITTEAIIKELAAKALRNSFAESESEHPDIFWQNSYIRIVSEIDKIFSTFELKDRAISDYFLFTIFGALITPEDTYVFSIGDGVYFLNGEFKKIGPFPNNTPPYLGYALVPENIYTGIAPSGFTIHAAIKTETLNFLLIGTDGVDHLIDAVGRKMPGKDKPVGPISQFWKDDRYFKNPDMIRRKLALINRTVTKIDWDNRNISKEHGLLPDDTTLIVIRRKKQ